MPLEEIPLCLSSAPRLEELAAIALRFRNDCLRLAMRMDIGRELRERFREDAAYLVRHCRRHHVCRATYMGERSESKRVCRRSALALFGYAAAFGLVASPAILMVSDAGAQTPPATPATPSTETPKSGTERRQERRTGRAERRQARRTGRTERREERRDGTTEEKK